MLKELKYLLFLIVIVLFFFLSFKYYFSNENKKNSYRSLKNIEDKTENYSRNLILLKSDTVNIVEYVEKSITPQGLCLIRNFFSLINNLVDFKPTIKLLRSSIIIY